MRRGTRRGDSDVVSTALVLSIVVAIGLGMFGLLTSYSSIERQGAAQSLNKDILVLRSVLGADYVYFPDWRLPEEAGYGAARLRNVGSERITLFRIIVYRNGSLVYDSGIDPASFVTINVGQSAEVYFRCPGCRRGDPILVTVHYLPTALINPRDPGSIEPLLRTELFKVASFNAAAPSAGIGESCPQPPRWIFVDFVDPLESAVVEDGMLVFEVVDEIKLRLLLASDKALDTSIEVKVVDENGHLTSGNTAVSGEPPIEIRVPLAGDRLRYPLTVSISSPDYTILPPEWRFNVKGDILFPDYAKLNVMYLSNEQAEEAYVNSFLVSAFSTDQATVEVELGIRDCTASYTSGGLLLLDFDPRGEMYQVSQGTYHLSKPTRIQNIYEVSIDYIDISDIEVVWETVTATVTTTTTATITTTTTTTMPSTTRTLTSTTTTTSTRTVYTSTTTTTSNITRTLTLTSTTTTTTTVTTRTITVTLYTSTATVTRTVTSTSYTTTSTVRVTSSTTQTITNYSPTVTTTITRTTTSYTTTYTVTYTVTSTSTARTTVTTTTTTTTTLSRAGGEVPVLPMEAGTINRSYEALLIMGAGLAASVGLAPVLWRLTRRLEVRAL